MLLTMPCHSYITYNTNTYTSYVSLYYLQCHAMHSYITNNTNTYATFVTYNAIPFLHY